MEDNKSNSAQNLGIAALIVGIITFVLAVIPCVGIMAIIPGIVTIVLASVGLSQASRSNSSKGVIIAGLVIGIVAMLISISQIFVAGRFAQHADKWPSDIKEAIEDIRTDVTRDLENSNVNIKIKTNGDTLEINAKATMKDAKVKQLEDLESGQTEQNDTLKKPK